MWSILKIGNVDRNRLDGINTTDTKVVITDFCHYILAL